MVEPVSGGQGSGPGAASVQNGANCTSVSAAAAGAASEGVMTVRPVDDRATNWPSSTAIRARKNIAEPITLAWAGMPRSEDTQTNFGKVLTAPELKFVMMKSSKDSANASRAPADDARGDERQGDPPERLPLVRVEVHRRLLQAWVQAGDPGLDGDDDEADAEHDVGDHDGPEAQRDTCVEEQREQ